MTLGTALFSIALVAVIASTFLSAGLAMTRATVHRLAQTYAAAAFARAQASLQQTLAADLRAGPLPSPLPAFTPIPATCVDASDPCRYTSAEAIALTQLALPASVPQCDVSTTNCASNEQANGYVDESRVSARITVTIAAASDGAILATRTRDVILRTMETPPYVVVAGNRDASFDDVVGRHALGDDGGVAAATPDPCATTFVPGTSDDTVVRVAYRNQVTNACTDGNAWRTESYQTSAASSW